MHTDDAELKAPDSILISYTWHIYSGVEIVHLVTLGPGGGSWFTLSDFHLYPSIVGIASGQRKGMNLLRNDVIETLRYLVDKIDSFKMSPSSANNVLISQKLGLCLDGLLTGLRCLPNSINRSPQFLEMLWQHLCPTLISILGNPRNLKTVSSSHDHHENSLGQSPGKSGFSSQMSLASVGSNLELGRGSGVSSSPPNLIGPNARLD